MLIPTLKKVTNLRVSSLIGPVFAGTVTLLSALTLTIVSAWLITRSWHMPPVMDITVAVTAVRALGISRSVFRYVDRILSHNIAFRAAAEARATMWDRVARASSANSAVHVSSWSRGSVLTRLGDDVDAIADVIIRAIVPICVAALTSILAVAFTALLSLPAAVALAVGLTIAGIGAPWLVYRGTRLTNAMYATAAEAHASAVDTIISHAPELRVRGDIDNALGRTRDTTLRLAHATTAAAPHNGASHGISTAASTMTAIATIVIAMWTYTATGGTPAHSPEWLTVMVLIPLAAFESVSVLPSAAIALARAHDAIGRLSTLWDDTDPGAADAGAADAGAELIEKPRLKAIELTTGYDSDLQTWNLDIPFGARKEIIAPSGAGKTTLLKTLAGLLPPRSGRIEIVDDSVTGNKGSSADNAVGPNSVRPADAAHVLFVAEDEHIFATTIRDNLAVGNPDATDTDMIELLGILGLRDWLAALPDGLSTILTHGDDTISGGQRRRLILARALLTHTPILLLDEPTEHLDTDSTDILKLLLHDAALPGTRPDRTIVVVRHPRQ